MEDRFTLRLRTPVPDMRRRFYVRVQPGDKYTIQTTEAGLLAYGRTFNDGGVQVLGKAVAVVPNAERLSVSSKACSAVDGFSVAAPNNAGPFTTTITIDPTLPADLERAEGQLCSVGARYKFVMTRVGTATPRAIVEEVDGRDQYPGLVYRRPEPYSFAIYREEEGAEAVRFVGAVDMSLPNLAPVERMAFPELAITTQDSVAFRDGMRVAGTGLPVRKRHKITIHFESGRDKGERRSEAHSPQSTQTNASAVAQEAAKGSNSQ
jgi:hypothetical protein